MPGPYVVKVHGDEILPDRVDVVIVGGGIVGSSTALELADRGYKVALCEKGGIAQEQSSRNLGWVRMWQRDPREIPLMAESMRLWGNMDKRTARTSGYRQWGLMFAEGTEKELERHIAWSKNLEGYQLTPQFLSAREVKDLIGDSGIKVAGAAYAPFDGQAEPQQAGPAIAEAARDRGASILTECAVRGFETTGGKISAAVTERGTIRCDAVVLAGGAWSNMFAGLYGIDLPQLNYRISMFRTTPVDGAPQQAFSGDGIGWRKRLDGGYNMTSDARVDVVPNSFKYFRQFQRAAKTQSINLRFGREFFHALARPKTWRMDEASPFEYERVLDPKPVGNDAAVLAHTAEKFPAFKTAKVAQSWGGYIDVTPDAVPVISAVDQIAGFFIATGMSGHGFGFGPGAGLLMADLVSGRKPSVDPTPYRFSRFSDGSPITPPENPLTSARSKSRVQS